jgi:hypothetical protein
MYLLNLQVQVTNENVELKGFWTARRIRVPLRGIVSVRKSRYKRNIWRRTAYNLHSKGVIRFYTSGEDFVELTDKQGFVFRIGSYRADQLFQILNTEINKKS